MTSGVVDWTLQSTQTSLDRLRFQLFESGYTEQNLCDLYRTDLESLYAGEGVEARSPFCHGEQLLMLTDVLLLGKTATRQQLEAVFPKRLFTALQDSYFLDCSDPDRCASRALLAPLKGLFVIFDRAAPMGSENTAEFVFPPLSRSTQRFLRALCPTACDRVLEIGCGCGYAGLLAAKTYAKEVIVADVSRRALRFAEFNRRLNSIQNASVVESDVYSGVSGWRCNRIISHPPYIPAPVTRYLFRDGGPMGEDVISGIVTGAPSILTDGGSLSCRTVLRVRTRVGILPLIEGWLGREACKYDVAFVSRHTEDARNQDSMARESVRVLGHLFIRHNLSRQVARSLSIARRDPDWPLLSWKTELDRFLASDFLERNLESCVFEWSNSVRLRPNRDDESGATISSDEPLLVRNMDVTNEIWPLLSNPSGLFQYKDIEFAMRHHLPDLPVARERILVGVKQMLSLGMLKCVTPTSRASN